MIEFFLNVIIVTGGVVCILGWIAFIVEMYDRIVHKDKSPVADDDYIETIRFDGRSR